MNESVKTGIGRSISEVPKDILAKLREKDEEYYSLCTSCIQAVTGSDTLGTGSGLLNLTKPKPNLTKLNQTKTKPNQTKPNSNIAEKSASDDSGVVGGIVGEGTDIEVIPDLTQDPKNKHVRRIGLFARFLNVKFTSKDHQASFIKRNLRSARLLDPYTDERILEVLIWLHNNADFKVTMETVGKYIDDDLEKLSINNTNNIPTL